ncbi:multifunctional methyltransferase subunit TRM112-like protein isoform X1 [Canis lupus familiaris]|uniref:multifunctional methyltransferase subunit TRM112-like protein isoform X1 n=1 Tax=Canis lupus familiaris TaxID=9615 RepID=UPI0006B3D37E|nr:multifunctional methyltransferase subunit TRM112-like protein isoform X1 [Canis lupus familiaris]XP_038281097.1 multifunctional methyltransferase subunit TRM112-like protein isoform X1 [Canis lupus familiaris]XP_038420043.1 multifunctional methyltransferase subunit TRM112-like protein isoform X1 [Canis lupus familiaris]|eukprot:XP_013976686.1 multifunctional methyltransferase subunit TRM112-like protein isoform X1 [Canis lupus familiaris]
MKLLTHNLLSSHVRGVGPRGFPLRLQATEVRINPVEFNPDFVARMIPKVEWAALLEAAETVRTLPHARVHLPGEWGGGEWSHRQPRARGGTPGDDLGLCPQLHLVEVPKGPIEGYEHDEKFLRQMHHVLLEVDVLEGTLQCPESGRLFPISRGIPNMLLSDEETET